MTAPIECSDAIRRIAKTYPYVLLDRIVEIDRHKKFVTAIKCTSHADGYYAGHFPDNPTMPGVLLLMSFSQVASLLYEGENLFLKRFERVRFMFPVRPGSALILTVEEIGASDHERSLQCRGVVDEKDCIKARLILSNKRNNGAI